MKSIYVASAWNDRAKAQRFAKSSKLGDSSEKGSDPFLLVLVVMAQGQVAEAVLQWDRCAVVVG